MIKITLSDPNDFLVYREGSGGSIEIFDIVVGSTRGVGKGRRLVRMLVERVKGETSLIFALTRESNLVAQQFYRAIGFRKLGILRKFYRDSREDAVAFGMDLQ